MKTNEIIERFSAASLSAGLPPAPYAAISNITRCACMRLRDRWFYVSSAACVLLFASGFLVAGVMINHSVLVLTGFGGFVLAIGLLFRLSPGKLIEQTMRAEAESERTVAAFAGSCQNVAENFGDSALEAFKKEAQSAMRDGDTLSEMAEFKEAARVAFLGLQSGGMAALTTNQVQCKAAQEQLQLKRGQLAAASQGWKPLFVAGPARRAAREVLNAVSKCSEARVAETTAKAEVRAYQVILDGLDTLPLIVTVDAPTALCISPTTPVWVGTTVPPFETLRATAVELVESKVKSIREKVIANSGQQTAEQTVKEEIESLFANGIPGAQSVEEHVESLNGDANEWAERVLREAQPFSPITPHVGRIRHRKCWCIAANAAGSASFRNLRESLSDQTAKLFPLEGPSAQMLFFDEERGVTPGEFDEFKPLFDAFRSLSAQEQRLLITACEPDDLIHFYPEFSRDENRPARLLACSLVFDVISRNGAELYLFEGVSIGKGFGTTLEALKVDQRLAAAISTKLESTTSNLGSATTAAKLKTARDQATSRVPKAYVKAFQAGIDDALGELNRRTALVQ
jgi:hypothetical protein